MTKFYQRAGNFHAGSFVFSDRAAIQNGLRIHL
jgi:hypothetical protein